MKRVKVNRDAITRAYMQQDGGASLPYFVTRQYGAGWLRNLARIAFPIVRKVLGLTGKVAANTAQDLINNEEKSFKDSLTENAKKEATKAIASGIKRVMPINSGKKNKIRKRHTIFARA